MTSLPNERTPCPQCGRDTRTPSDGVCVERWRHKQTQAAFFGRPPARPPRGRGGNVVDDIMDWIIDAIFPSW